jgi:hypothetical protein
MRVFFAGAVDSIVVTATSWSDYVIVDLFARCEIALPYRLASFQGKPVTEGVSLSWTVSMEYSVTAYAVERSADGLHWERIAEIPVKPEGLPAKTYQYTDLRPAAGKNYYRLQSIETGGPGAYSRVISVRSGAVESGSGILQVYPNPATQNMVIRIPAATAHGAVAEVLTTEGKLYQRIQLSSDATTVSTGHWPRGIYVMRVSDRQGMQGVMKIVLQ